jgi:ParB family chromosome partitioning protein
MTTTAGEKVVGLPGQKEKAEKRRALGRGLESLLPGPRVVAPAGSAGAVAAVEGGGAEQIPHRGFAPVRNDNVVGDLQGVVEDGAAVFSLPSSSSSSASLVVDPLLATAARSGAPGTSAVAEKKQVPPLASLRSDIGRDGNVKEFERNNGADNEGTISIAAQAGIPSNIVANISLDAIDKNPYQTRLIFEEDALDDLAQSIRQSGVVQPVVVRPGEEEGRYILVLGERRLRASKMAGKETIPAIVRRVSELQAAELTIVENMQRENLNCMEQAEAFRVLSKDFNLTQAQIAEKVGVSRESVSNYMRLLKLPVPIQDYLIAGGLGFSEAMVLLQMENVDKLQWLADTAVEKCWNVEQLRDAVMRLDGYLDPKPGLDPNEKPKVKGGARWVDPNVRAAQNDLQRLLGMRVRIRDKKGRGKIMIEYATVDDYERVVGMLRKQ